MSEHKVIEIIYDTEQEDFDFIVPANADKFIKGSERELMEILERLRNRLVYREYPFAHLNDLNEA